MKPLIVIFLVLLGLIGSLNAKSQSVSITEKDMTFTDRDGTTFYSTRSRTVKLPSGFILKTASFQLPEDHPIVPEKGTKIIAMRFVLSYLTDESGEPILDDEGNKIPLEFITDEKVDINHKGKFNVSMHLNGAGHSLPVGWYDPTFYE